MRIDDSNRGYYMIAIIAIALTMAIAVITATPEERERLFSSMSEAIPGQVQIFGTN